MRKSIFLLIIGLSTLLWKVESSPLPVYGTLDSFALQTQDKNYFTAKDLKGHITIVNFILTSCQGPCPLLSAQMSEIQRMTKRFGPHVKLVSISIDPNRDTPEKLKTYARRFGADFQRWTFLTGSLDGIE